MSCEEKDQEIERLNAEIARLQNLMANPRIVIRERSTRDIPPQVLDALRHASARDIEGAEDT